VRLGRLRVTEHIKAYEVRRLFSHVILSRNPLEFPPRPSMTVGFWIEIEAVLAEKISSAGLEFMGGIHAIEHALISMFPLFAVCDRNDIGGILLPLPPAGEKGAIFVYDGYPGGIGLAARGYEIILPLIEKTRELIASCACSEGCPACIHSPKCGAGKQASRQGGCPGPAPIPVRGKGLADPVESPSEPAPPRPPDPQPPARSIKDFRIGFFDLETRKLADEVGAGRTRTSCGFPLPSCTRRPPALPACTGGAGTGPDRGPQKAGPHCRVQHLKFDYRVLSAYTPFKLDLLPTFDMLQEIYRGLGFRVGLGHLGEKTLRPAERGRRAPGRQVVSERRLGQPHPLLRGRRSAYPRSFSPRPRKGLPGLRGQKRTRAADTNSVENRGFNPGQ